MTDPHAKACARCGAPPGEPCTFPSGRKADAPHAVRRGIPQYLGNRALLSTDLADEIVRLVSTGVPVTYAAAHAGINKSTLMRWLALSELTDANHAPHRELRERLERARADAVVKHIGIINKAAEGGYIRRKSERVAPDGTTEREVVYADVDWRASDTLLSKQYREFVPRKAVEYVNTGDGLTPEQGAGGVLDGPGLDRLVENLRLFRERRAIEAEVVEGEIVEEDP